MKNGILVIFFILTVLRTYGQINRADSTAQAITYWQKGEKQNYTVTSKKIKVLETDTLLKETTTYDVEVTVLNVDEKSRTIEWFYKNGITNSENPVVQKLISIIDGMKVVFKTDELGVFIEVENWKEIKSYIQQSISTLRKNSENMPETDKAIQQIEIAYSTKEALELSSIRYIQQFHFFYGIKYKLREVIEGKLKVPNVYGSEPFDTDLSIYLDKINEKDNNFTIRAKQEIDKEQLINTAFHHFMAMTKNMKVAPPKRENLKNIENKTLTVSRIHETGWLIYSAQTLTVVSDILTNIEERIIELK